MLHPPYYIVWYIRKAAVRPARRKFRREPPEPSGQRERTKVAAQLVAPIKRRTFAEGTHAIFLPNIADDFAGVVKVVLPKEGTLRADGSLDHRDNRPGRRQPPHDVTSPRPGVQVKANRLTLDRFARHQTKSPSP